MKINHHNNKTYLFKYYNYYDVKNMRNYIEIKLFRGKSSVWI